MKLKHRLAIMVAACLAATGIVIAPTSVAYASPICTTYAHVPVPAGYYLMLPVTSSGSADCFLAQGDFSDAVWMLQSTLVACYGQNIATDHDFGPNTKAALAYVQGHVLHVNADGVYGSQTRNAMSFEDGGANSVHCSPY